MKKKLSDFLPFKKNDINRHSKANLVINKHLSSSSDSLSNMLHTHALSKSINITNFHENSKKYCNVYLYSIAHFSCMVIQPKCITISLSTPPPPVCSIHMNDETAATGKWWQCTHHTPVEWRERESDMRLFYFNKGLFCKHILVFFR